LDGFRSKSGRGSVRVFERPIAPTQQTITPDERRTVSRSTPAPVEIPLPTSRDDSTAQRDYQTRFQSIRDGAHVQFTKDGKSYTKQATGREFIWDFDEEARRIRGVIPGLPIAASQFERLIASCRNLEREPAAATLVQLTLKS
jgi:hypothetical protein